VNCFENQQELLMRGFLAALPDERPDANGTRVSETRVLIECDRVVFPEAVGRIMQKQEARSDIRATAPIQLFP
jgi:hypothetical protein